jgi:hypothetical protein
MENRVVTQKRARDLCAGAFHVQADRYVVNFPSGNVPCIRFIIRRNDNSAPFACTVKLRNAKHADTVINRVLGVSR